MSFNSHSLKLLGDTSASDTDDLESCIEKPLLSDKEQEEDVHELQKRRFNWRSILDALSCLKPSFVKSPNSTAQNYATSQTEYLNGVRGVASCVVFIHHFVLDWFPRLRYGYGSFDDYHLLMQLPIIRLIYSGRSMVAIFFVISGYVLSTKALRHMYQGRGSAVLDTLSSLALRRGLRLFLPAAVSTFLSMIFCHLGWYIHDPDGYNLLPSKEHSLWLQLNDWWTQLLSILDPFQRIDATYFFVPEYDSHLWTLPIEYRGSIVVFTTLLALSQIRAGLRTAALAIFALYTLSIGHTHLFLFLSGTFLAAISPCFASDRAEICTPPKKRPSSYLLSAAKFLFLVSFLVTSLWILSFPDQGYTSAFGYSTLSSYTPGDNDITKFMQAQTFWLAIGGFLFVACLVISPTLQRPFTSSFTQYLGRISFSLYLVHGPILYTLGMLFLVGKNSEAQLPASMTTAEDNLTPHWRDTADSWIYGGWFCVALVVNTSTCFYAADLFCRGVDEKSVNFARWLERIIKRKGM